MSATVAVLFAQGPKVTPSQAYASRVETMEDDDFFEECKRVLLLAAFASSDPSSAFHWQHKICAVQATLRDREDLYDKALAEKSAPRAMANGRHA